MVLDGLVTTGISLATAIAVFGICSAMYSSEVGIIAAYITFFFDIGTPSYYLVGLLRGHTVGRSAMKYYLVRDNGEPLRFWRAIARNLVSVFSAIVLYLGYFAALWTPKRQTWHDSVTQVVAVVGSKPNVERSALRWAIVGSILTAAAVIVLIETTELSSLDFNDDSYYNDSYYSYEYGY